MRRRAWSLKWNRNTLKSLDLLTDFGVVGRPKRGIHV